MRHFAERNGESVIYLSMEGGHLPFPFPPSNCCCRGRQMSPASVVALIEGDPQWFEAPGGKSRPDSTTDLDLPCFSP